MGTLKRWSERAEPGAWGRHQNLQVPMNGSCVRRTLEHSSTSQKHVTHLSEVQSFTQVQQRKRNGRTQTHGYLSPAGSMAPVLPTFHTLLKTLGHRIGPQSHLGCPLAGWQN